MKMIPEYQADVVIAGLRLLKHEIEQGSLDDDLKRLICGDAGGAPPTSEEIDQLCARLAEFE